MADPNVRPRIALLCQSLTGTGGTERVVSTLSDILSDHFEMFEFSFDAPGSRPHFKSPAHFVALGPSLRLPLVLRPVSYLHDAYRLRRAKARFAIALTISNLWRADLLSVLSQGPDRKISLCHINVAENSTNRLLMRFRPIVAAIYRRFDCVVAVSRPLGAEIRSLFRLEDRKTCVIHNCVPGGGVRGVNDTSRTRVVWCGRFVQEKNVLALIDLFAESKRKLPALQLVMLGDGPLRASVEARIAQAGLTAGNSLSDLHSDVILTGFVQDPVRYIACCDFQVLPSNAEGLGMVLIEGFSVGIPALASDCSSGGVHDAMGGHGDYRPGRTSPEQTTCGFLLPVPDFSVPRSVEAWSDAIVMLATDPELRRRLSEGASERARHFSASRILPLWTKLLSQVI